MAIDLGKYLGLSESELIDLELLAELLDLGKVTIPKEIVEKEKELTFEERKILKNILK